MRRRRRRSVRKNLYRILYNPEQRYFLLTNDVLAITTLISIVGLVLESVAALAPYQPVFTTIEYTTVGIFTLEYLARIYAHGKDWRRYVFSFYGCIDLVAILPTYLHLANFTFLKAARVLRIMQLLRIVRITKLAHYQPNRHSGEPEDVYTYRLTLQIYFFALFAAIVFFGALMYTFEGHNPTFANIPLSMLWAVKPLLGGIAQTQPETIAGNIIVAIIRFVGLILFGLLISIVGQSARKFLFGKNSS